MYSKLQLVEEYLIQDLLIITKEKMKQDHLEPHPRIFQQQKQYLTNKLILKKEKNLKQKRLKERLIEIYILLQIIILGTLLLISMQIIKMLLDQTMEILQPADHLEHLQQHGFLTCLLLTQAMQIITYLLSIKDNNLNLKRQIKSNLQNLTL